MLNKQITEDYMKSLQKIGDEIIIDVCKIDSKPLSYVEEVKNTDSTVVIDRTFSTSKDGKNWNRYQKFYYGWVTDLEIGDYVRVKYKLIASLMSSEILIGKFQILQESHPHIFDQGESFLLSGADNVIDIAKMSEKMQKVEIDMNYWINYHSALYVNYWHTNPDKESTDRFLNEYSLYNVVSNKMIKCVVKDNAVPEPKHEFTQWGIEFEKLEIYFEKSYFEEVFGINEKPRTNDYLYFKEINRMYYITDVYLDRGINENGTYYICTIKKYEDMTNVKKSESDLDYLKRNLNIDDYIEDDLDEMEDMVNNDQNMEKNIIYDDVRHFTHKKLNTVEEAFYNNGNDIGKFYYNMKFNIPNTPLVVYNKKVHMDENGGMSVMFWFRLLNKKEKVFIFQLEDENVENFTISYDKDRFNVYLSKFDLSDSILIDIPENEWICVVLGFNNQHSYWSVDLYNVSPHSLQTTALAHIDHKEKQYPTIDKKSLGQLPAKFIINPSVTSLISGEYNIRMIRISNYCIEEAHHSYIMGLRNVKKPSAFFIIDDCEKNFNNYHVNRSIFPHLDDTFNKKKPNISLL